MTLRDPVRPARAAGVRRSAGPEARSAGSLPLLRSLLFRLLDVALRLHCFLCGLAADPGRILCGQCVVQSGLCGPASV